VGAVTCVFVETGVALGAWILEQLYQAEIVSSRDNVTIWGSIDTIHVVNLSAWWEDTVDTPAAATSPRGPWLVLIFTGTMGVTLTSLCIEIGHAIANERL